MKLNKMTTMMMAAGMLLVGSVSCYKVYADAAEKVDEVFIPSLIIDAAKQPVLTKADLVKATKVKENPQVKKVELPEKDFMKKLTPGLYTVDLAITTSFNQTVDKKVTIQVVDTEGPTITIDGELKLTQGAELAKDQINAVDQVSGVVPDEKIAVQGLDAEKVGEQQVTITAEDRAGNVSEKKVTVQVAAPVVEIPETAQEEATPQTANQESNQAAPVSATAAIVMENPVEVPAAVNEAPVPQTAHKLRQQSLPHRSL